MMQSLVLDGPARGMGKLYEQLRWGKSAKRPGLADTLLVTNHHMGGMLDQMRQLDEARVRELRDRNRAEAAAEREAAGQ
ncbi:hypothetical protein AB0I66_21585 [Streptomyces sp. NPDC050439]|uniref:hypothetical protein n=1 Tax=unclassified Streptomyces TaxID=2593676 RepID=UPI003440962C